MAQLHHYDWLFAVGVIFFLISVWGIGVGILTCETRDWTDLSTG